MANSERTNDSPVKPFYVFCLRTDLIHNPEVSTMKVNNLLLRAFLKSHLEESDLDGQLKFQVLKITEEEQKCLSLSSCDT